MEIILTIMLIMNNKDENKFSNNNGNNFEKKL